MSPVAFGLKTWPQWSGWGICRLTGSLYDPHSNLYAPEYIASAFMALRAGLNRDRLVWADAGDRRRFTDVSDTLPMHPRPLQQQRERANAQHLRVLQLPLGSLRY